MTTIEIHDDLFGHLKWERNVLGAGHVDVAGTSVDLNVNVYKPADITPAMRAAFRRCQQANFDYRAAVAAELLNTFNNNWNNDASIDAATFASRITLYSIYVNNDATVDFWYHDDDMFGGHGIFAVVNAEGTVERAEMAG